MTRKEFEFKLSENFDAVISPNLSMLEDEEQLIIGQT
jgi:hypothetical protein